jgi:hypothetical protein
MSQDLIISYLHGIEEGEDIPAGSKSTNLRTPSLSFEMNVIWPSWTRKSAVDKETSWRSFPMTVNLYGSSCPSAHTQVTMDEGMTYL